MRRSYKISLTSTVADLMDKELVDKASLWILRIILNLGGHRDFIDKDGDLRNENIVYFLGLDKYAEMDSENYERSEVINILKAKILILENQKKITSTEVLSNNMHQISKLMNLNTYEEQILEFVILLKQYEVLENAINLLGNEFNSVQLKRNISIILNIPKTEVEKAFASNSKLTKSSLVYIDKNFKSSMESKLESISDTFLENMLGLDEDISVMIKDAVKPCGTSDLSFKDYKHIEKDLDILLPYLVSAVKKRQQGVNILLYGLPGTGKTELTKVLAKRLRTKLFEVSYTDDEDSPIDGTKRLKAYKSAQALLGSKRTLLMYDEAEDIFESSSNFFGPPQRQKDKAWINRVLETNTIPTIWITNNIDSIDNAIIRRFDMSIEMPIPSKNKRAEIIKNYSNDLLDKKSIELLSKHEHIAPALISTTAKVISSIDSSDSNEAFTHLLNNTLKAQGFENIQLQDSYDSLPSVYNPNYINSDIDLEDLAHGIKENPNARLCLYGVPGTGKSAFGKYMAQTLNKPFLLKKGSDLISKWVGGTEQNIANAFREAKEEGAILIFDEVDSFLADRTQAKQSWEVTQVNEMLVQMENFDGVFIATTNLMDNLDKASLRRFDLKLEFNYLKPKQAWEIFISYCKDLKLAKPSLSFKKKVIGLRCLTPGDFAAVVRQSRFRPLKGVDDLLNRLEKELEVKNISGSSVMGFLANKD